MTHFEKRREEQLQSYRTEYPLVVSIWRFITVARGLLIVTAVTGISAVMNTLRGGYLKTKQVVLNKSGESLTIADDTVTLLAGAALIFGLGIVSYIVLLIDRDLDLLQDQCVQRGVQCESFLGLREGLFSRAVVHKKLIQRPFRLAHNVLLVIWLGWVYFIWSISQ